MNLNNLLQLKNIDPKHVLVLRHRPLESELNKWLPWLAAERHEVFNAYQQTQTKQVEKEMLRAKYVAAFIGYGSGKALFVGLYLVNSSKQITRNQFCKIPAAIKLKKFGVRPEEFERSSFIWFDLVLTDFYLDWKGKLIVSWPPLDKNWHRWAYKTNNEMPVLAILEESALNAKMPEWYEIDLTWDQLRMLPTKWRSKLSEWRGIYYIFDSSDGKGYIGSAYGENNLLGRWLNYSSRGHGGNRLLRRRNPQNFRFSILQRVSPDMTPEEIIRIESSWKQRLHTREPHGLNGN